MESWSGYGQRHENYELASNTVLAVKCYNVSGQSRLNVARPGYENIVSCLLSGPVPACQPPVMAHPNLQVRQTLSRHISNPIFVVLGLGIGRYVSHLHQAPESAPHPSKRGGIALPRLLDHVYTPPTRTFLPLPLITLHSSLGLLDPKLWPWIWRF